MYSESGQKANTYQVCIPTALVQPYISTLNTMINHIVLEVVEVVLFFPNSGRPDEATYRRRVEGGGGPAFRGPGTEV